MSVGMRGLGQRCAVLCALAVLLWFAGPARAAQTSRPLPNRPACLDGKADRVATTTPGIVGVPPRRREELARGVNVTDLLGPDGEGNVDDFFRYLRQVGIRHVRIPVSPALFASEPPIWRDDVLTRLDQAVCAAIGADLGIVLDLHPDDQPFVPAGAPVEVVAARLKVVWRELATRYGRASPEHVFFEILNEPKLPDGQQWGRVQKAIAHVIRVAAPNNTIIATASPWSTAEALSAMTPLKDRNVAYAFHFYTPMVFTHQSAEWAVPSYASVRDLEFPAQPENVANVARQAAPSLQPALADYAETLGDVQRITAELDAAGQWARQHDAVVVTTEFGVYGHTAPRPSRAAWLQRVRSGLEQRGIGWTVWEFKGGFGIDDDLRQGCHVADSAATALGLCGS
jgi:endoglucanase